MYTRSNARALNYQSRKANALWFCGPIAGGSRCGGFKGTHPGTFGQSEARGSAGLANVKEASRGPHGPANAEKLRPELHVGLCSSLVS